MNSRIHTGSSVTRIGFVLMLVGFMVLALSQAPASAATVVSAKNVPTGTILVRTSQRRLYYGLGNGKAIVYRVGVGRAGKQWTGSTRIWRKARNPAWAPTQQIIRDNPNVPRLVPGGSPRNPLGAAALVLAKGNYAIHGTNKPGSIGGFVSYGCIRMHNRDIKDLYKRVSWGTRVVVTR
ncbi:MAG: L,D-transpeptidase [Ahrensia sp.]|nr:L,D-transpeptidase [Ahrensia sp.]